MKTQLFAPEIDRIIESAGRNSAPMNREIREKLINLYTIFECVKIVGGDKLREIWIEVARGPIEAFGDYNDFYESGEVENYGDFEFLWKETYPEPTKWYKFQTASFEGIHYFYFGGKLNWQIKIIQIPGEDVNPGWNLEIYERFAAWLLEMMIIETTRLKNNVTGYNAYIQQHLPWSKRFGKIKRSDYWAILGAETIRPDLGLGNEMIEKLKTTVTKINEKPFPLLDEMTASLFFHVVELCYDANGYFSKSATTLSPREKYAAMADGRHAGLKDIEGDDAEAFQQWYNSSVHLGAHPWEICRGGNSTHISLQVYSKDEKWKFYLAGSSIGRVEETVRMAIAMFENNIPFEMKNAEAILRMVTGEDFIGIVPENITPRYCHPLFPDKDRIIDFMNLGFEKEIVIPLIEKASWYPLDKIEVENGDNS